MTDPNVEPALAYLPIYDALTEASQYKLCSLFQRITSSRQASCIHAKRGRATETVEDQWHTRLALWLLRRAAQGGASRANAQMRRQQVAADKRMETGLGFAGTE